MHIYKIMAIDALLYSYSNSYISQVLIQFDDKVHDESAHSLASATNRPLLVSPASRISTLQNTMRLQRARLEGLLLLQFSPCV